MEKYRFNFKDLKSCLEIMNLFTYSMSATGSTGSVNGEAKRFGCCDAEKEREEQKKGGE